MILIYKYKDGKYFNEKGKEIEQDKALNILYKLNNKGNLGELVQTLA